MGEEGPLDEEEEWLETQKAPIGTVQVEICQSYIIENMSFSIEQVHPLVNPLCTDVASHN